MDHPVDPYHMNMSPPEGHKDDQEKTRWDLLPYDVLELVAQVLTLGAVKYGDRNWEQGFDWSRAHAAANRHLNRDWWEAREDLDPETKINHLAHALCEVAFLLAFQLRGVGMDNRPPLKAMYVEWEPIKPRPSGLPSPAA